jgi:hypothetical protein
MKIRFVRTVTVALGLWAVTASAALAQAPVVNPPVVAGANVTLSWSATAGATSYNIQVGLAPGAYSQEFNVGNVTSISTSAPLAATFYVRVVALPGGETSSEVVVPVTSLVNLPAAPTGLQVFRNGTSVIITWTPGAGGGPVAGYRLRAGLTPGGAEVGVLPTATAGFAAGSVPPNTYYLGVAAVNAAGESGEATGVLVMPANGACDTPPTPTLTTTAWGPYLTASWSPVPGASAFYLHANGPGFQGQVPIAGNQTSFSHYGLPQGTWAFGIQAQFSCGTVGGVGLSNLIADGAALKLEPRAADPPAGQALAGPSYGAQVVRDMAAAYPVQLAQSCGNDTWLFLVLRELRKRDKRWGLNWKRANIGDHSTDIITYNWGPDGDEGTPKMRAWDVIGGHCGPSPGPNWDEKTSPAPPQFNGPTSIGGNGAPLSALWTLIPYIRAGFTP